MHAPLTSPFLRFWCYQLAVYDCDPALYVMRYLFNRFEFNREQRLWLCWLYANTYQLPTAWVMWNEFPDFENVGVRRLTRWTELNKHRLPYQKDQKWLRGRLPETFAAYQQAVGGRTQDEFWSEYDGYFDAAWGLIQSRTFPRFGRYTAWFYLQALMETCGLDFTPRQLFLTDPSSEMPRRGLLAAAGMDPDVWDPGMVPDLEWYAGELIEAAETVVGTQDLPVRPNRFSLETSLCAYAKLGRGAPKGRYLGYYLDRFAQDILNTAHHGWDGIHWGALWESRQEILLPELNFSHVRPEEMEARPLLGECTTDAILSHRLDRWFNQHRNQQP
jgi:hypothetical protein